jgi:hypothetical protein
MTCNMGILLMVDTPPVHFPPVTLVAGGFSFIRPVHNVSPRRLSISTFGGGRLGRGYKSTLSVRAF